jgi:hypothetical protein
MDWYNPGNGTSQIRRAKNPVRQPVAGSGPDPETRISGDGDENSPVSAEANQDDTESGLKTLFVTFFSSSPFFQLFFLVHCLVDWDKLRGT